MRDKLKHFWAKRWLRWAIIILVVIVGGILIFGGGAKSIYETTPVATGSVMETVTATGQVKQKSYASLRFKTTGTISRVNVEVGDTVYAGQVLAVLDTGDLSRRLTQTEADLVSARVGLQNAQQDVLDQKVKNDQAIVVLYAGAPSVFNDVLNLTQQVYATFVSFYDSMQRLNSAISGAILDSQLVVDANNAKILADSAMVKIKLSLEGFSVSADNEAIDQTSQSVHASLQNMQSALNSLINTVAAIPNGAVAAATLDTYKTALATARTNLNSAISKEISITTDIRDARIQSSLTVNSKEAAERSASANVEKAKASLAIAEQNLSDAYLKAPFSGTIAARSKQVGELVTTADQAYYLLGNGGIEVVANVPEVDIARIQPGTEVISTFDAFSADEEFSLTVDSIEPDQTTVDGVVYYKTHFSFKNEDARFKSGMSVNLVMTSDRRDNVLVVPRRAVAQRSGETTVRIISADNQSDLPETRSVVVGLRGDTMVEILSGVKLGEEVVVSEKKTN